MITLTAKIYVTSADIITVDSKNALRISSYLSDRGDIKKPSFGVISNSGDIEFNDIDGTVLEYATNGMLVEGVKCEIYLTNTLVSGLSKLIGEYETGEWSYDNEDKVVRVTIKDDLQELQSINYEGFSYDPRDTTHRSLAWFYDKLRTATVKAGHEMLTVGELDEKTQIMLNNFMVKYPMLEKGSLWAEWQKFCEVGQTHIYKEKGVIKCRYNGGN
jgi:hypothetical protein